MIFYGTKASNLGQQIINAKCDACNSQTKQKVTTFGKYAHIYWIPFFPIGRKSVSECQSCYKTIPNNQFNQNINQAYSLNKPKVPIRHWSGGIILALLISGIWFKSATREIDPRQELLKAEEQKMTSTPDKELDSTSYLLKAYFDDFVAGEMQPENFEYHTQVDDDKLLVLVEIPTLKNLANDQKPLITQMINQLIDISEGIKDKQRYIGVKGNFVYDVGSTPVNGSGDISAKDIYEFFGPKENFASPDN